MAAGLSARFGGDASEALPDQFAHLLTRLRAAEREAPEPGGPVEDPPDA